MPGPSHTHKHKHACMHTHSHTYQLLLCSPQQLLHAAQQEWERDAGIGQVSKKVNKEVEYWLEDSMRSRFMSSSQVKMLCVVLMRHYNYCPGSNTPLYLLSENSVSLNSYSGANHNQNTDRHSVHCSYKRIKSPCVE